MPKSYTILQNFTKSIEENSKYLVQRGSIRNQDLTENNDQHPSCRNLNSGDTSSTARAALSHKEDMVWDPIRLRMRPVCKTQGASKGSSMTSVKSIMTTEIQSPDLGISSSCHRSHDLFDDDCDSSTSKRACIHGPKCSQDLTQDNASSPQNYLNTCEGEGTDHMLNEEGLALQSSGTSAYSTDIAPSSQPSDVSHGGYKRIY